MADTTRTVTIHPRREPGPARSIENEIEVLRGEYQWVATGPDSDLAEIAKALPGVAEQLGSVVILSFGNSVGFVDIPHYGRVEIRSGKWGRPHYDAMLADLMRIAGALPFGAGESAALPYDRSLAARDEVLYHAFVYLRHILSEAAPRDDQILPMLRLVVRDPHRRATRERAHIDVPRCSKPDERTVHDVLTARAFQRTSGGGALAAALGGHLPDRVSEPIVLRDVDTAENRFVKAFVAQAMGIVTAMRGKLQARRQDAWIAWALADCNAMERDLAPIARDRLWRDVGPLVHVPAASTVLQRRRGYRHIFRHAIRLRQATRVPLEEKVVRDLLEARDIATLYEIWCYFTVVALLSEALGPPQAARVLPADTWQLSVPRGLTTVWQRSNGETIECLYNAYFAHVDTKQAARTHRASYSLPLKPDVTIAVQRAGETVFHLLDAKFRREQLPDLDTAAAVAVDDETTGQDARDEREVDDLGRSRSKHVDIYKMHTYRDAIAGTRTVSVLYPGTADRFFDAPDGGGVGAIPLIPGRIDELRSYLIDRVLVHD